MVNIKFGFLYFLPQETFLAFFLNICHVITLYMQVERKWKMDINTDINEKIMERYHISLT